MAYKYLTEQHEVQDLLPTLMSKRFWAVDSETTGLDYYTDKMLLFQIGDAENQYIIDTRTTSLEPLRPFFENDNYSKIGHNLKFDYKMLKTNANIEMERCRCTYLAEKIYNNGRKLKGFGLDDVLESYLEVKLDKTLQKSFIGHEGRFSEAQLQYAADDIKYLLPLLDKMKPLLQEDRLQDTWSLECNCIPAFGDMELYGVLLNKEKWQGVIADNLSKARQLASEMDEFVYPYCDEDVFGKVEFNYGSPAQIVKLLQRMKAKVKEWNPGTKEYVYLPVKDSKDETLLKIHNIPIIGKLQDYRSYMVMASTFGQSFIDSIHPVTGRIHPDFHQIGTETGRIASGDSPVNFLNIPQDKRMRNSFMAPEDYLIETDDFSGCELRIWAHLSQDPGLVEALRRGEDLHCYVATKLYGKSVTKKENAELRKPAKSLNFGIAYGMQARKLFNKLNAEGFPITFDDAKKLFDKYCAEFAVGVDYLRDNGRLALRQGYLANANGRRRYWIRPNPDDREKFPLGTLDGKYRGVCAAIEREGGNFLIQSVNADITKFAMISMRNKIKADKIKSNLMLQVYDEIVTCTHKDHSEEWSHIKQKIMIQAAEAWINSVPIEVDGHILPYWTK